MKRKKLPSTEKSYDEDDIFWMTPEEYAGIFTGTWMNVPRDRTDSFLARGVRTLVTREMALEHHAAMVETALWFGSPVPVTTVQFHGLPLPKGYVQEGDLYVKPRRKVKKKKTGKKHSPASI